ncbi:hypothetical protein PHYBOEH_008262 [Phytophthora boehmeriae]|uniref:Bzip transcription factor n=1 Tax=Phytophthora boehmeriae TaxID=109152 RepID=A0A8T1W6E4_9STRA|nr:hypothetical protein PHYBOEH_008262 [Phytophthora boehmeriae]
MNFESALYPPHYQRFSDAVISDVMQRSGLDRSITDDYSVSVVTKETISVKTNESKRQEEVVPVDKETKKAAKLTWRERNRIHQAQYKLRQKTLERNLNIRVQSLRKEVEMLQTQKQHLEITRTPFTNSTVWNVAAEYFRLFRYGSNRTEISSNVSESEYSGNAVSPTHLTFLQQTMTSDVKIETGSGIEAMVESWTLSSNYFNDMDSRLVRLEDGPGETLVGISKVRIGVTLQTLQHVFPHLIEGRKLTPLGERMIGQQFYFTCSMYIEWDSSKGRISSMTYDADFMTPLLQLLGNLEDVSHVFDGAYVTPDAKMAALIAA